MASFCCNAYIIMLRYLILNFSAFPIMVLRQNFYLSTSIVALEFLKCDYTLKQITSGYIAIQKLHNDWTLKFNQNS